MIDQAQFTNKWIQQVAKKHKADPLLIEKSFVLCYCWKV